MPANQQVDIQKEIELHDMRKEARQSVEKFVKSVSFTDVEKEEFMKQVKSITGDRDLPANELKPILA